MDWIEILVLAGLVTLFCFVVAYAVALLCYVGIVDHCLIPVFQLMV
jgi:hypothetical protein